MERRKLPSALAYKTRITLEAVENDARLQSGCPDNWRIFEPCSSHIQVYRVSSYGLAYCSIGACAVTGPSTTVRIPDDTNSYEIFIGSLDLMDRCYQNRNSAEKEIKVKAVKYLYRPRVDSLECTTSKTDSHPLQHIQRFNKFWK
jgi:hypothetical protein